MTEILSTLASGNISKKKSSKNFSIFRAGLVFTSLILAASLALADDAQVLPKGRFRIRLYSAYSEATNKFDGTGDAITLGSTFSKDMNAKFVSMLSPKAKELIKALNSVKPGLGDSLNFGTLKTDIDSKIFANAFCLEYGLTERLSVGLILPVIRAETRLNSVSTPDDKLDQFASTFPDPRVKAALGDLKKSMTVAGLNSVLKNEQYHYTNGLDSWSGTGIGDLEIGGKYNYYKEFPVQMTVKAGVRLPTGRTDDADNLTDVAFGDGQFDIGAYNYIDYRLLSNLSFTLETGYTVQLPDTTSVRVPLSQDLPVGDTTLKLDRKLGDYWEAGLEGNYTFLKYMTASAKYHFKQKFSDSYSGGNGIDLSPLEVDTEQILHEGQFQLEYSSIPAVRAGTSKFPYTVAAFYNQPFAGENVLDSRMFGLQLKAYF